jgi:SAM-dependent methyltransferase
VAENLADLQSGRRRRQESELRQELVVPAAFKDHFSRQSDGYAKHRPRYPGGLFSFLASTVDNHDSAWDCATGNGQAAIALASYFSAVIATDASRQQIEAAHAHPGVEYRVATAENSGLADQSVDLVTVAQALHWFDQDAFFAEAKRVLRPEGVLAVWCYELCEVTEQCDRVIDTLYREIVGDYWPPERVMIEEGYASVTMPGTPVAAPMLQMQLDWRVENMLGYLRTWSACKRFESDHQRDPVDDIEAALRSAWGPSERPVSWPLKIKVCQPNTLLE